MSYKQNILVIRDKNILMPAKVDEFKAYLKSAYHIEELPLTHSSQLFRTTFYLKKSSIKKISLIIFKTGTVLLQGSLKINKEIFEAETNQIKKMIREL